MNLGTNKPFVDYLLCDSTQVRTVVKIADELDMCPMVLFKFILLPRENKLKILEQIKQGLLEGDLVKADDVYRHHQVNIDEESEMMDFSYFWRFNQGGPQRNIITNFPYHQFP